MLWNGTSFSSKGIIVEKTPNIKRPKKRYDEYEVEGRNGLLIIDKKTYESFVIDIECHINSDVTSIEEVSSFLDGFGKLSIDGVREYEAILNNNIDIEKLKMFKKFRLSFLCNPVALSIQSKTINAKTTPTFTIQSNTETFPIVKVKGTGQVTISFNNKSFVLYDLVSNIEYTLDCNAKVIYNSNGINCSNQMSNDFPVLKPGENNVTTIGTITKLSIEYKEAYI